MTEFDRGRMIVHRSRAEQEMINRMLSPLDLPTIRGEVLRIHDDLSIRKKYYGGRLTNTEAALLLDVLNALLTEIERLRRLRVPLGRNGPRRAKSSLAA